MQVKGQRTKCPVFVLLLSSTNTETTLSFEHLLIRSTNKIITTANTTVYLLYFGLAILIKTLNMLHFFPFNLLYGFFFCAARKRRIE